MKKFLSKLFLAVLTIMTVMVMTVWAGTADIQFGDPTTTRGKTFELVVKVKSKDVKLATADLTIHYDPEKLEFDSGTDSEGGSGMVRINGKGNGAGTTMLTYRLKFKALAAGKTQITLQTYEVTDKNDNPVNIEHRGTSTVNVKSASTTSKNANLKSLDVQPGEIQPTFDSNIQEYSCEVNSDVNNVIINAYPEDNDAKIEIKGNEELKVGENKVEIQITAPNNSSKKTYVVRVTKLDTGITPGGQSVVDGQRFVSEKYYVTYMDFPDDAKIFDGYVESTAIISNNEYKVWTEEGNKNPQYCIFYGMDQNGDVGYYRYDQYKYTVQRNFQDPGSEGLRRQAANEEEAVAKYNKLVKEQRIWLIACICLGAFCVILIVIVIILLLKKGGQPGPSFRDKDEFDDDEDDDDDFFAPKKEKINRVKPDKPVEKVGQVIPDEEDDFIVDNNDTFDKKGDSLDIEDLN